MHPRMTLGLAVVFAGTGLVAAQVMPPAAPRVPVTVVPVDPAAQIAALQQQIASLQAAVTALQLKTQLISSNGINFSVASGASAVTVTPTNVAVTSPMVMLNGNGSAAARVKDPVQIPPVAMNPGTNWTSGGSGQIVQGSRTVLIGD